MSGRVSVSAAQHAGRTDGKLDDGAALDLDTELDLASLWVARYGLDGFRSVPGIGWMHYAKGGDRWQRDELLQRYDTAKNVALLASMRAQKASECRALASAKTVNAIINLAASDPRIALAADRLDADAFALNTPEGVVDLRTGTLRPRRVIDYVTQCARVSPSTVDAAPTWQRFLLDVFCGDAELIEFIQRVAGYFLTGDRREQLLFFLYGLGANGKSTFVDVLKHAMGSYAMTLPAQVLMQSQLQNHPTELAQLHRTRLAVSSELEEGQYWAEARIKELTGDEVLRARYMRQDFFEFRMTHKHAIVGNYKPRLKGGDQALARRFVLVPFRARFAGAKRDRTMVDKLKAEAPGVLAWAVAGAVKWHAEGLAIPASVAAASAEYMRDNDDLSIWIEERCMCIDGVRSQASKLYEDYAKWLRTRGQQVPSMKLWADRMNVLEGVSKLKSHGVMVYVGLGLMAV